jgi:signal transduction histidine kinase
MVLACALLWGIGMDLMAQSQRIDSLRQVLSTQGPDSMRARTLLRLAHALQYDDEESAQSYALEAIRLADSLNLPSIRAKGYNLRSQILSGIGIQDQALECVMIAIETFSSLKDTLSIAEALINLGMVYDDIGNHQKSMETYVKSEKLYSIKGSQRGVLAARHNYAVSLTNQGDTLLARRYYQETMPKLLDEKYPDVMAATYNNYARLFARAAESDSALYYYRLALRYKLPTKRSSSIANTLLNIAETYLKIDALEEADKTLDSAKVWVRKSTSFEIQLYFHDAQAKLFRKQGRLVPALASLDSARRFQDSLYNQNRIELASQADARYRSKEQQSAISLMQKEAEVEKAGRSRLMWISLALAGVLILVILLLIMAILRGRERKRTYRLLLRKNEEIQRQQVEIVFQNAQLASQNRRLEELNREKDGLISVVAHDLRAPLNRTAALSELVRSAGDLSAEQIRYMEMIQKVNEDGGRLIQDLLEMNSYENNEFLIEKQRVNLNEVVAHSVSGFEKAARTKSISIHIASSLQPIEAHTDEKLLSRVIDNLLSNAIKFTKAGKNVYISVGKDAQGAQVVIRDEGQGISIEDQKKMFRKFQRLSARPTAGESSTGLGLSIVKTLVDRLEGEIKLQSEVGKGTEIEISLPHAN